MSDVEKKDSEMADSRQLLEIFVFPERRAPAQAVSEVEAIQDQGLAGDHPRTGKRQVTLLSLETWQETMGELGAALPASARRANLVVTGVDLPGSVGRRLRIGDVVIQVEGETTPCDRMEEQRAGLRDALVPRMRGGVFGRVTTGGQLRAGLPVEVLD